LILHTEMEHKTGSGQSQSQSQPQPEERGVNSGSCVGVNWSEHGVTPGTGHTQDSSGSNHWITPDRHPVFPPVYNSYGYHHQEPTPGYSGYGTHNP
jgi:hypothetical protein